MKKDELIEATRILSITLPYFSILHSIYIKFFFCLPRYVIIVSPLMRECKLHESTGLSWSLLFHHCLEFFIFKYIC